MEERICGECRHHLFDAESEDWVCENPESENHGSWTGYEDSCEEWEGRE